MEQQTKPPRRPDGTISNAHKMPPQLPRKGKIRLGIKKQKPDPTTPGKFIEYPAEVSYFVCPPEVQKVFGEQPTELEVMFVVNDDRVNFYQAYKWYSSTQALKCKGDGAFAIRSYRDLAPEQKKEISGVHQDFDKVEIPCPCPMLDAKNGCRHVATLSFFIPKASMAGVYQIDIRSTYSIRNIEAGLMMCRAATQGPKFPDGTVARIPMKLIRKPQKIEYQGKMNTHYLLHLEHQLTNEEALKYRSGGEVPLLPAGQETAALNAPENPGAMASEFSEEPGSTGAVEDVPEDERGSVVKVLVKEVAKSELTYSYKPGQIYAITSVAAPPAAPENVPFITNDRAVAEVAYKAIKLGTPMNVYFTMLPDGKAFAMKVEPA